MFGLDVVGSRQKLLIYTELLMDQRGTLCSASVVANLYHRLPVAIPQCVVFYISILTEIGIFDLAIRIRSRHGSSNARCSFKLLPVQAVQLRRRQ